MKKHLRYNVVIFFILVLACKKSKEARQLEKYLSNSQWEFYYAEDAQGNDITEQVLADSAICLCFNFLEDDNDPVTFNTIVSKCRNTFFDSYNGYWGVFDYKDNRFGFNPAHHTRWKSHGVAVGNMGIESQNNKNYLINISFFVEINGTEMFSKRYKVESNGLTSDSLMEIRYYKKL